LLLDAGCVTLRRESFGHLHVR